MKKEVINYTEAQPHATIIWLIIHSIQVIGLRTHFWWGHENKRHRVFSRRTDGKVEVQLEVSPTLVKRKQVTTVGKTGIITEGDNKSRDNGE